jgi:ATP/maltotriose-dependent transcriptional regulator MalT
MMGFVQMRLENTKEAERLLREASRLLKPLEDRGTLVETQRMLAQVLLSQGKVDEAERYALEAAKTVGTQDESSRATTRMALGLVRAAQGRDEEAETLLRDALAILEGTGYRRARLEPMTVLASFLRDRGRDAEAVQVEERLTELQPRNAAQIA